MSTASHHNQPPTSLPRLDKDGDSQLPDALESESGPDADLHASACNREATGPSEDLPNVDPDKAVTSDPVKPKRPSEAGLLLRTDITTPILANTSPPMLSEPLEPPTYDDDLHILKPDDRNNTFQLRRPDFKHRTSFESVASNGSPVSTISSPALAALNDVTPLPSPIFPTSTEMWRKIAGRPHSSSSAATLAREDASLPPSVTVLGTPPRKKKAYANLGVPSSPAAPREDTPTRAISEFVPDALQNVRPRNITLPTVAMPLPEPSPPDGLHREEYLGTPTPSPSVAKDTVPNDGRAALPSPPPSNKSVADSDEGDAHPDSQDLETVSVFSGEHRQYWKLMQRLGHGSFSEVFLARQVPSKSAPVLRLRAYTDGQSLVAVKIVRHQSARGSDEERMETSIRREIEILRKIVHPCLPQLLGCEVDDNRAVLILNYCPGGDLFELASQKREILTPPVIQRIFAEVADAVAYLHDNGIVHRDIKLENILLNHSASALSLSILPATPLTTLTDLGLARYIPTPPASPLLTHACGSADYAAPELLLGQPYDGRLTDAWALGVLLYALMEGRLPFDPLPSSYTNPVTGRTTRRRGGGGGTNVKHRIARCDWLWCEYGDEDGEWADETPAGREMQGAREIVEGLLRKVGRGRWGVGKVKAREWVRTGLPKDWGEVVRRASVVADETMG